MFWWVTGMSRDRKKGPIRGYSSWWSPGLLGSCLLHSQWNSWTPAEHQPSFRDFLPLNFRVMHVVHTLSFSTSWRSLNMPWGTRDGWRPLLYSVCGSRRHNNTQLVPHSLYYRQYLLLYSLSTDSDVSLGETVMAVQREERLVDRLADLTSAGIYCSLLGREVSYHRILQLHLQLQDRWRIPKKCFKEAKYRSFPIPSYTLHKLAIIYFLPPLVSS